MDSSMQTFLDQRKINLDDLAKAASTSKSAAEQRELARGASELADTPLKTEDLFKMNMTFQKTLISNLQDKCFSACADKWDVQYLTYTEGLCVRNCFTKFNNWYPTFEQNIGDAPVKDYYSLLQEAKQANK